MKQPKLRTLALAMALVMSPQYFAEEAAAVNDGTDNQATVTDDDNAGEVIVIVRKREENVMDVSIAMSVFSIEDMQCC